MSAEKLNPYVGPRTFTEEERKFFFGRDREARDLLSLIVSERMVLFYAQSGAGKSSLVNARIIPYLTEKENFLVLPVGRVSGELPQGIDEVDNIFVFNLLLSIDQSQRAPERFTQMSIKHFLQNLTTLDGRSYFYAEPEEPDPDEPEVEFVEPPHILFIDQFEEILTTHLNRWEDRQDFFEQLNEAMVEDPKLWVVLTLREDYIAGLRPYGRVMQNNMRARYYMKRMEADAGQQAVEMPAELGKPKRSFAPGVAKSLVNDLRQIRVQGSDKTQRGQFIEPVQLQVVCFQLWQNLEGSDSTVITQEDVDKLGDVDTALASFYEQAIAKAIHETAVSEIELRNWFDHELITEAETRGTVYQGSEETAGMKNEVVRVLADQYLLRAEIRAGGTWYELVHDRFVSPILHANQAWRLRQSPLIRAAEEWDKSDDPERLLILGDGLKQILASTDLATAEPVVRAYLEASQEAQRKIDLERTAKEQAKLAEEERQKAEAQARTARKLRALSVGLVFFVILAVVAAFFAFGQAQVAEEQKANAEAASTVAVEQQSTAEAASTVAVEQQEIAEDEKQTADEQRATAVAAQATAVILQEIAEQEAENAETAREVAVEAQEKAEELEQESLAKSLAAQSFRINSLTNDNQLAALLAIEALKVHNELVAKIDIAVDTAATSAGLSLIDSSIRETLNQPAFSSILFGTRDDIIDTALSPDGQTLAVATYIDGINLFDLSQPHVPPQFLASFYDDHIQFSADGNYLITAGAEGLYVIDVETGEESPIAEDVPLGYMDISFRDSQPSPFIITTDYEETVQAWDFASFIQTGDVAPSILTNAKLNDDYLGLSPDGNLLATGNGSTVNLWDLSIPGATLYLTVRDADNADIITVAFSPDGRFMATGDANGVVRIWDIENILNGGDPTPVRLGSETEQATYITFSPDGSELFSGHRDGTIRRWFWQENGTVHDQLSGHSGEIKFLVFDPTGDVLISVGADNNVRHWNLATSRANLILRNGDPEPHETTAVSNDGRFVAITGGDGTTTLHNLNALEAPPALLNPPNPQTLEAFSLTFSPDNNKLASAHFYDDPDKFYDSNLYIWDVNNITAPPIVIETTLEEIGDVAFHPNGRHVVATNWSDPNVYIWDTENPQLDPVVINTFADDPDLIGVQAVAFNEDGSLLATATTGDAIQIWEDPLNNPTQVYDLTAFELSESEDFLPYASSIAFSPIDGRIIVGGDHGKVYIWDMDVPEAMPIVADTGTSFRPVFVNFSPEGNNVTTSTGDTKILLWDINLADEGNLAVPIELNGHKAPVFSTAFTNDASLLLSAGLDGEVRQWSVDLHDLVDETCSLIIRNLSPEQWMTYRAEEDDSKYEPTCPYEFEGH